MKDTMEVLNISRVTVYRLIKKGILIPVKIGSKNLFRPEDLNRFIEQSKKPVSLS